LWETRGREERKRKRYKSESHVARQMRHKHTSHTPHKHRHRHRHTSSRIKRWVGDGERSLGVSSFFPFFLHVRLFVPHLSRQQEKEEEIESRREMASLTGKIKRSRMIKGWT